MKNRKSLATIVFILGMLCTLPVFAQKELTDENLGEPNVQDVNVVDVNVAKIAAADRLPVFYTGEWDYFTHFVLYNLAGEPAAYAIVFSKEESDANSLLKLPPAENDKTQTIATLEESMSATRKRISSLSSSIRQIAQDGNMSGKEINRKIAVLRKELNAANDRLLGIDSFVTVVTGANNTMPVVLKCHKGLPTAFLKKTDALDLLKSEYPNKQWEIGRFLYLSPFDEAFEAKPVFPEEGAIREELSVEALVVDMRTRHIKTVTELIKRKIELEREKQRQKEQDPTMEAEENAREAQNKKLWGMYRQRFLRGKQSLSIPAEKKKETIEPKEGKKEKQEAEESGSVKSLQDTDKTSDRRAGPSDLKPSPDLLEESEAPGEEKSRVKGDRSSNKNQR